MSDKELTELLKADPQAGLTAVIKKYTPFVWTIATGKLSGVCPKEDIEETVSDVFAAFYNNGRKNGFEFLSVKAYLTVLAKRRFINLFHSRTRREEPLSI